MIRSLQDLTNYKISATDGDIGHIVDFYFDDDAWVVRYFVVKTGTWLSSRQVLISPISVVQPVWEERKLPVCISKAQVQSSPNIDTDKPISRQNEVHFYGYYGYPYYWDGLGLWGGGLYPYAMVPGYTGYGLDRLARKRELEAYLEDERDRHRNDDPHLRSCQAVMGYHIHASDGDIGHVVDFLLDDRTWAIRHLVVETSHWWSGHRVLIAPHWTRGVDWSQQTVAVGMTRDSVRLAPAYDPSIAWGENEDAHLYRHHGYGGHAAGKPGAAASDDKSHAHKAP